MGPSYPLQVAQDSPFGIHNIPFGIISEGKDGVKKAATAVGEYAIVLDALLKYGIFEAAKLPADIFLQPTLNQFAALPTQDRRLVRSTIIAHLENKDSPLFQDASLNRSAFVPIDQVEVHMPVSVTDYTDFFSSLVHAENALRPFEIPVPAAFYEYPMGYNGRISSIAVSGTDFARPCGIFRTTPDAPTSFQASRKLDFEVEMAAIISTPVADGKRISAKEAPDHIFGYVLLNDWSSRDIQKHEMTPFGPFHSKSFRTSISPWVVTLDALSHSRCSLPASMPVSAAPLLDCDERNHGLYDISLSAKITRNGEEVEIVRSNLADAHWSPFQMAAYQSSSGCGLHTGDILGTGTLSSPDLRGSGSDTKGSWSTFGCMAEINATGHALPTVGGSKIEWLEDGDKLQFEGWFTTANGQRGGFGGVTGTVKPALLAGIHNTPKL